MKNTLILLAAVLLASNVLADIFGTGANQFTIDFVDISGDTNPASGIPTGTGFIFMGVNNDYRIGTYEITNDQWNKFVNAYGTVTGSPSTAYDEGPDWTGTNKPINEVSWFEAAQFVNWLNTSSGYTQAYKFTGTQGQSNYTFVPWGAGDTGYDADNPFRNSEAFYFLPTKNEWFKAAYWNGMSLQTYATTDDSIPVAGVDTLFDLETFGPPWNVGSGSEELNGTFDMMGNVTEWMENPHAAGRYTSGAGRSVHGGGYRSDYDILSSSALRRFNYPDAEGNNKGFRVASVVYEPVISINVDVKPGSCPNPVRVNFKGNGVIPVAILGTEELNVADIDVATITLEGVAPLRSNLDDVSSPSDGEDCECNREGPDGLLDLTEIEHRTDIPLTLTAMLMGEEVELEGADCIRILNRMRKK